MEYRVIYEHRAWQHYDDPLKSHETLEEAVTHLIEVYNNDHKIVAMDAPDVALLIFDGETQILRFGYPYRLPENTKVLDFLKAELEKKNTK